MTVLCQLIRPSCEVEHEQLEHRREKDGPRKDGEYQDLSKDPANWFCQSSQRRDHDAT